MGREKLIIKSVQGNWKVLCPCSFWTELNSYLLLFLSGTQTVASDFFLRDVICWSTVVLPIDRLLTSLRALINPQSFIQYEYCPGQYTWSFYPIICVKPTFFSSIFFPIRLLHLGIGRTEVLLILSLGKDTLFICLFIIYLRIYFPQGSAWDLVMLYVFKTNKRTEKRIHEKDVQITSFLDWCHHFSIVLTHFSLWKISYGSLSYWQVWGSLNDEAQ